MRSIYWVSRNTKFDKAQETKTMMRQSPQGFIQFILEGRARNRKFAIIIVLDV